MIWNAILTVILRIIVAVLCAMVYKDLLRKIGLRLVIFGHRTNKSDDQVKTKLS